MKKIIITAMAIMMLFVFTACGKPDLTGTWYQINAGSSGELQYAVITKDEIEIYWSTDRGETKSLYWSGTCEELTKSGDSYTFKSTNNTEKTSSALLASSDSTKEFTYQDGVLKYEISILGVYSDIELQKSE